MKQSTYITTFRRFSKADEIEMQTNPERLDQGDGIDSWGHATLAGSGRWDWFMGHAMGPCDTGWIGAMGLIHRASPWGRHGGARLDRGDGIDLWGSAMGVRHWPDVGDGIELWGRAMGARDWIGAMKLICGGAPKGHTTLTRSWWWGWFMWAHHGGARHWLDRGDGIDSWGRAKWQNTIWLLNLNDDTICPHVWRWGECTDCVWLRVGRCKLMGGCEGGGGPSVGWRGCAPHVLNHQWVRVGGVICVRQKGVGGLIEGRGSVKCRGDKESWAYTGLEDGWRTEGAGGRGGRGRGGGAEGGRWQWMGGESGA